MNPPGPFRRADEHLFHAQQIVADEERLLDLGQQEVDGDVRHEIAFDAASQWLVAHRGWIVTHIERLPAS